MPASAELRTQIGESSLLEALRSHMKEGGDFVRDLDHADLAELIRLGVLAETEKMSEGRIIMQLVVETDIYSDITEGVGVSASIQLETPRANLSMTGRFANSADTDALVLAAQPEIEGHDEAGRSLGGLIGPQLTENLRDPKTLVMSGLNYLFSDTGTQITELSLAQVEGQQVRLQAQIQPVQQ